MSVKPPNPLYQEARMLRLKKRFAQHFLIRDDVLEAIVACLHLQPDETVVEIGPGAGFLTAKLLEKSRLVVAVELERDMVAYLQEKFSGHAHLHLVAQDILRFDMGHIAAPRFKVVGNLPYQISSRILFYLVGELDDPGYALRSRVEAITVMVQKEVGERIIAKPGEKAYNPLSIAAQWWFEGRLEFLVPGSAFFPPPKVESAVVTLIPRAQPRMPVADYRLLARLVRTAFAQKRKTLRNALLNGQFAPAQTIDAVLAHVGVDPQSRAEALSPDTFGELANAFHSYASQD